MEAVQNNIYCINEKIQMTEMALSRLKELRKSLTTSYRIEK